MKAGHVLLCIGAFFAMVAPGLLAIFLFRPELYDRYDVVKLTLLSVSLTIPLVIVNFFLRWFSECFDIKQDRSGDDVEQTLFASFLLTCMAIFPALLIAYWFALHFRWFCGIIALSEILFVLAMRKKRRAKIRIRKV